MCRGLLSHSFVKFICWCDVMGVDSVWWCCSCTLSLMFYILSSPLTVSWIFPTAESRCACHRLEKKNHLYRLCCSATVVSSCHVYRLGYSSTATAPGMQLLRYNTSAAASWLHCLMPHLSCSATAAECTIMLDAAVNIEKSWWCSSDINGLFMTHF